MTTPSPDAALIEEARKRWAASEFFKTPAPDRIGAWGADRLANALADALSRRGGMEITGRQVFDAFRAEWPKLVEWGQQCEYQASYKRVAKALTSPASNSGEEAKRQPTHRHRLRGTSYEVLGTALMQIASGIEVDDDEECTVYRGDDGRLWVRPTSEFNDGRFEEIPRP